jgi:glutamate-1-semialdehyde 2,1-aminomutase
MVKFAKNGSNVTTAAVKVARAYTGRRYVCIPRQHPFFSFDDWFIGTTPVQRGVAMEQAAPTLVFDYNDLASLKRHFEEHPGEIAAVMLEPATHITPLTARRGAGTLGEGFDAAPRPAAQLSFTRCRISPEAEGALAHLRRDDHRLPLAPAGRADLFRRCSRTCRPSARRWRTASALAALTGRRGGDGSGRSIDKPGMERTFLLSTTHGGEMPALGAFIEATRINREEDVPAHLWRYGRGFRSGFAEAAPATACQDLSSPKGPRSRSLHVTQGPDGPAVHGDAHAALAGDAEAPA